MSDSSRNSRGIGIIDLLGVVFVTLKLLGVIDWSWWWVTAPFWGGILLSFSFGCIVFLVVVVLDIFKKRKKRGGK